MDDSNLIPALTFVPQQPIVAKVMDINRKKKKLFVTARLSETFDYRIDVRAILILAGVNIANCLLLQFAINNLEQYFVDIARIQNYCLSCNDDLAQINVGQHVNGVVDKLGESGGCFLNLNVGVQGLVDVKHCPGEISFI